jgi:hypothetical protein
MEDEGNFHVVAICDTRQEIAEFVREDTADGYFSVGNFIYIGSHFSTRGGGVSQELQDFLPENMREWTNQ